MSVTFHLPATEVHEDEMYKLGLTMEDDGSINWRSIRSVHIQVWTVDGRPTASQSTTNWKPSGSRGGMVCERYWFQDLEQHENYKFIVSLQTRTHVLKTVESEQLRVVPWFSY
ncbi:hypothetical protein CIB48_g12168 [Xylaria polymorpha]|nr:hypothetical protein CIB48_g12168 [Xylaria polymorpha]